MSSRYPYPVHIEDPDVYPNIIPGRPQTHRGTGPPPLPPSTRVGPQKTPGIANTTTAPAPSIFQDYSGPEVDAAKTLIKTYMGLLGWPQSIDTEQMALDLLKNGLENQPQEAFDHLWSSRFLTDDMRRASPWARFGQDPDTFHQNLTSMQDTIKKLTGQDVGLGDMTKPTTDNMQNLLQSAIKGNWSQGQILDFFQAGSFTGIGGQKVDLSAISAAQPWLASGQTYQQQAQQYHTIYGAAPVDTNQLAAWYRFNQPTGTMGPWYARQAMTAQATTPASLTETVVR